MEQIAATVGAQAMPASASKLAGQIIGVLRRYHDRTMAPMDIAEILNLRSEVDLTNVRVLLSRMSRDGRVRKVGRARYMTL
jgi:predicted transcriptional regulator of viral defense system